MTQLACFALLELPHERGKVRCDLALGHQDKHSGALAGQRYWWSAPHARVRNLRRRRT